MNHWFFPPYYFELWTTKSRISYFLYFGSVVSTEHILTIIMQRITPYSSTRSWINMIFYFDGIFSIRTEYHNKFEILTLRMWHYNVIFYNFVILNCWMRCLISVLRNRYMTLWGQIYNVIIEKNGSIYALHFCPVM